MSCSRSSRMSLAKKSTSLSFSVRRNSQVLLPDGRSTIRKPLPCFGVFRTASTSFEQRTSRCKVTMQTSSGWNTPPTLVLSASVSTCKASRSSSLIYLASTMASPTGSPVWNYSTTSSSMVRLGFATRRKSSPRALSSR